jgi:hypothetical protein
MIIHYSIDASIPETVDLLSFTAFAVWLKRMKVKETADSRSLADWELLFRALQTGSTDLPIDLSRDDHYYQILRIHSVEI